MFDEFDTEYRCNCSRERFSKALISLGKNELSAMISEGKEIEMTCRFCDNVQKFSPEELVALLGEAKNK